MNKVYGIVALATVFAGCAGSSSSRPEGGGTAATFVEAFIEFPGPDAKWAGPDSIVLHVDARSAQVAKIEFTPALAVRTKGGRSLAFATDAPAHPLFREVPTRMVRDRLAALGEELESPDRPFAGCLNPVRVWLIRADDEVVEKKGCRTQVSWTRASSRAFSDILSAWLGV